jgi:hypothetical protein
MAIIDDIIGDADIGPLWAKHFRRIGVDVESKTLVLTLVYIIEDKAKARATDGDWSDRVPQELRRHGIPADEFWEIYSAAST